MNKPVPPVVIIGCGYIGRLVARHHLLQGDVVSAVVRSPESAEKLQAEGIPAVALDLARPTRQPLATANSRVYHFAPPPATGKEDIVTRNLLQVLQPPQRLVYISTTGVYGDCQGQWVDEDQPVNPQADRAKRRVDAEQQLTAYSREHATGLAIVRVAGIYGPGKLPLQRLQRKDPVIREEESPWTNRIFADDLVKILLATMEYDADYAIFHGCDGQPGTMAGYFSAIARHAGLEEPPRISLAEGEHQLSAGMLSYMRESRRLSNHKTLQRLAVNLDYPDLESGLAACF